MSWTKEKIYTKASEIKDYLGLTEEEEKQMQVILERFPMSVPDYYLSLIDKNDPADPIRRMCIPSLTETDLSGDFDTSGEADNTVQTGLQHKYTQTALVLSTNCCSMYCRHCFRKRLVGVDNTETAKQFDSMMQYIEEHKELTNVLVSGGDSLMLPNHMIRKYLQRLTAMEHLDLIRFGTRIPVVFPDRVLKDPELQEIFREYADKKQIYIVTQFNHPKELTPQAKEVIRIFRKMGIIVKNQTVLLKGVNDDPKVLGQLLRDLTAAGVVPYYIFQCRPVSGVGGHFQVPLMEGYQIVEKAKYMQNGQGKGVRYVLSNTKGKIEILGQLDKTHMVFKYHQSKYPENRGKILIEEITPEQAWIDGRFLKDLSL